jgi:hypothetical protein
VANTLTSAAQFRPQIISLPTGGFLIAWLGHGGGAGQDVYYRRFSSNGSALDADDVRANGLGNDPVTSGDQGNHKLATLADGSVVIAYEDRGSGDLFGVRVGANGTALDAPGEPAGNKQFQINLETIHEQTAPSVAALASGGFVVAFNTETNGSAASRRLLGRVFSPDGIGGAEFQIGDHTSRWQDSHIAGLPQGDFVVTWQVQNEGEDAGAHAWSVYEQRFSPVGAPRSIPSRVNTHNTGDQEQPVLAAFKAGYVIAWQSFGQDSSRYGVFARATVPGLLSLRIFSTIPEVSVSFVGEPGRVHQLQRSSDFIFWTPVITTNPPDGMFRYDESFARPLVHFYRVDTF